MTMNLDRKGEAVSDVKIPEDVRELAVRAFYIAGFPGGDLPTAVMEQDILAMVGSAILAERERCAKIAEDGWNNKTTNVGLVIAKAIRSPHE